MLSMPLGIGTRLGLFELVAPIGAGGMGEVYRAVQSGLDREVAIKVLHWKAGTDTERLRRFEQEARAASSLNHPSIISIYDIGRADGVSYIAMEFVDGRTIRALLQAGPVAIKKTLQIAAQIADGLAKAHAVGIVHRDIKPENIMVNREGRAKILDFGLAKLVPVPNSGAVTVSGMATGAAPVTNPGTLLGTVAYMSPEQARGMEVDYRSDIFSFGSVLYEMLTGKQPFRKESPAQTLAAIIEDDPEPVSDLNPKIPGPLRWIVERCLAKDPQDRYASTLDLARDLESVRDHLSDSGMAAVRTTAKPAVHAWLRIFSWVALGVIAGALLAYFFLPQSASNPVTLRTLTFSGTDLAPSVSPDGRTVAFQSSRDGASRIWLKQLDTGSETALTSGPDDGLPRYSPDGSWILFIRSRALYRVPALGGDPRKILDNVGEADWSPDASQIVFLRLELNGATLNTSIGIASAQDGSYRMVRVIQNELLTAPSWSPDGSTIAFVPRGSGGTSTVKAQSLFLMSVDGKELRRLSCPLRGGGISAVAWTGSGEQVIYSLPESPADSGARGTSAASVSSAGHVLIQNIRSGKVRVLFAVNAPVSRVEMAGPGRMVFDSLSQRNNLKELSLGSGHDVVGRWLTHGNSIDRQPYYSPDGLSAVFSTSRSGEIDLWEVSTVNNSLRRLTDHPAVDWDPFVTYDNKYLLWSSNRSGNFEVWVADRDGTAPRQVTHDGYDADNPAATRDGWVIYATNSPAHPGLWKVRLDGTQPSQVVSGSVVWPDVSPDGQFALYHSVSGAQGRRHISVVRIADGVPAKFSADGIRARFSPDGHSILYVNPQREIVSQPFPSSGGGPATVLVPASADATISSFHVSPDGKRLVVSYAETSGSLVIADGVPNVAAPIRAK